AGDHRIKAVGTVAAADAPRHFRYGGDGTQDPTVFQGCSTPPQPRAAEARGEGPQTFPLFPNTAEEAFARGGQYGLEAFDYYCTPRGQHPRSTKQMAWISVDRMTFFDAFRGAELIAPRPLLLIVGREAVTSWMSVGVYQQAQDPKELHWIEGATHVDLYDKDEYVTPAIAKLTDFYKANLAAAVDKLAFAG
ncbi:MAG TPA: alpha/beta hydrolase, partial [Solirubrobacteraceae bacterium]